MKQEREKIVESARKGEIIMIVIDSNLGEMGCGTTAGYHSGRWWKEYNL